VRDTAFFHSVAPIFGKPDRIFMKILSQMYLWTRKSPLGCGSHLDPWQRSAFLECSCFKSTVAEMFLVDKMFM